MSNNFLSSNFLRWLTLYLLLALAILLFIVNLFPQNSQGATSKTATPTVLAIKYIHQTATAMAKSATQVAAQATANANATATAIAKNPIMLANAPVELPLTKLDAQGLMNANANAKKAIINLIQKDPDLKGRLAALVMVYVGVDTNDPTKIANAQAVASKIEGILQNPSTDPAFVKSVYRSVVYVGTVTTVDNKMLTGTKDLSEADLEIYLYSPGP